jgi:hypothetical protein
MVLLYERLGGNRSTLSTRVSATEVQTHREAGHQRQARKLGICQSSLGFLADSLNRIQYLANNIRLLRNDDLNKHRTLSLLTDLVLFLRDTLDQSLSVSWNFGIS